MSALKHLRIKIQVPSNFNYMEIFLVYLAGVMMTTVLFLSFRRVVNVLYSFLGNSPASEI